MLLAHVGEPYFVIKETFAGKLTFMSVTPSSVVFAVSSVDTMDN